MGFGINFAIIAIAGLNSFIYGYPRPEELPNLGIIRGTASKGIPFICSLRVNGNHICGAGLINETCAVTAAHCIQKVSEDYKYSIECGTILIDSKLSVKRDVDPIVHPGYNNKKQTNDIAILLLKESIKMKPGKLESLKLPSPDCKLLPYGKMASIGGWGITENNDDNTSSTLLMETKVPIIRKEDPGCESYGDYITKSNFCAGFANSTTDSCKGDSGGPLIINGTLHGVVSFGAGCNEENYAGVYTKVCNYIDWIVNNKVSEEDMKAGKKDTKKKNDKESNKKDKEEKGTKKKDKENKNDKGSKKDDKPTKKDMEKAKKDLKRRLKLEKEQQKLLKLIKQLTKQLNKKRS